MMEPNEPPFDRGEYLLPAGCKDVIDKIRLAQEQSRRRFRRPLKQRERPVVYLPSQVTVRDLATALGAKLHTAIAVLKEMRVFTSVKQKIPFHTAAKAAKSYGYQAKKRG